jgi:hypothetical protein
LQKLKAAKNTVGLHALHEDRKRLPKERGNLVKGLAKGVVELGEDVGREGEALFTNATKGLDTNRNESVARTFQDVQELVVLVIFSHLGTCSGPLRSFLKARLSERRAEGDIEEDGEGGEARDSNRENEVGAVGRAIDERDGDLFLHRDTSLAAPGEDEVTVGIMSVDDVASIGARIDMVTIGVNLLLLAKGAEGISGKDFGTKRYLETDLELIRTKVEIFGGFGSRVFPAHAVRGLLRKEECDLAFGALLDDLVFDGEVNLC